MRLLNLDLVKSQTHKLIIYYITVVAVYWIYGNGLIPLLDSNRLVFTRNSNLSIELTVL